MNLPLEKIPRHIAIIMDGNGRWAQKRRHPRVYGHIRGASRVREIVRESGKLGVHALTLYAFSTENWTRPSSEIRVLWKILSRYLERETGELDEQNVRLKVIGDVHRLDPVIQTQIKKSENALNKNTGLQLNLAISYGARQEILGAVSAFAQACVSGQATPDSITEELFESYLYTDHLNGNADVDLVIRTSGEHRISNFLLWQSAYAEYLFTDALWPDFTRESLRRAIQDFGSRKRRFGGIKEAGT